MDAEGKQSISIVNVANRYHVLASDRLIALDSHSQELQPHMCSVRYGLPYFNLG